MRGSRGKKSPNGARANRRAAVRSNRRTLVSLQRHKYERRGSVNHVKANRDILVSFWSERCPTDGDPKAWADFCEAARKATHLTGRDVLQLMDMVWITDRLAERREIARLSAEHAPKHPALAHLPRPTTGARTHG